MDRVIEFNGVKYALVSGGRYYMSVSTTNAGRKRAKGLHVAVWEYYNGREVPKGYHVHHKDGNTLNNDISNLELIEAHLHISSHSKANFSDDGYRERNKVQLSEARKKASEWHKSEDGRKRHSEVAKAIDTTPTNEQICEFCGRRFKSYRLKAKFCSDSCGEKYRRRLNSFTGTCLQCGKEFSYGKAKASIPDRMFCCRSCAAVYRNTHRSRSKRS